MRNIRGLASVVQAVVLMFLAVSAIAAVWGYVKDLSADLDNQLSPAVDCINQQSKAVNACVNAEGKILVNVDVAIEESIRNARFRIGQESFACSPNTCSSCSFRGEGRNTIYLDSINPSLASESIFVSLNGCEASQLPINSCL